MVQVSEVPAYQAQALEQYYQIGLAFIYLFFTVIYWSYPHMRKIERYPTDKYKEGKIHILM